MDSTCVAHSLRVIYCLVASNYCVVQDHHGYSYNENLAEHSRMNAYTGSHLILFRTGD
jgi:hypothetical protein